MLPDICLAIIPNTATDEEVWERIHELEKEEGQEIEEWDHFVWAKTMKQPDLTAHGRYLPDNPVSPSFYCPAGEPAGLAGAFVWRAMHKIAQDPPVLWGHVGRGWMSFGISEGDCAKPLRKHFAIVARFQRSTVSK